MGLRKNLRIKEDEHSYFEGYRLFHNYIRKHEALMGKTSAEKCGIRIDGDNKWLTITQNAIRELR